MSVNLKRRIQGLERSVSPRPTALEGLKAVALGKMGDDELALLSKVVARSPQKAGTVEEEAALRHFAAEFALAQRALMSGDPS